MTDDEWAFGNSGAPDEASETGWWIGEDAGDRDFRCWPVAADLCAADRQLSQVRGDQINVVITRPRSGTAHALLPLLLATAICTLRFANIRNPQVRRTMSEQCSFRCPLCDRRFVDDIARHRHLLDNTTCNAIEAILRLQSLLADREEAVAVARRQRDEAREAMRRRQLLSCESPPAPITAADRLPWH